MRPAPARDGCAHAVLFDPRHFGDALVEVHFGEGVLEVAVDRSEERRVGKD